MVGRRWLYKPLVERLEEGVLYHVAKILDEGDAAGLFKFRFDDPTIPITDDTERRKIRRKARDALATMQRKLGEPEGENEVFKPYRSHYRAWYGKTWKAIGKN